MLRPSTIDACACSRKGLNRGRSGPRSRPVSGHSKPASKVEIKEEVKTGHFLEPTTDLLGRGTAGPKGHVERPENDRDDLSVITGRSYGVRSNPKQATVTPNRSTS
jgi:hypothetical protein